MDLKEEKKYFFSTKRSPIDIRDYKAEAIYPKPKSLLPESYDLRTVLRPIRDQGNQGTCVAQTGACIKEYQEFIQSNLNYYFSPQFIYNNREDPTTEGMYCRDMMKILNKYGCCLERTFPYGSTALNKSIIKEAFQEANNYRSKEYAQVNTVDTLKSAIIQNGVCCIAVPVFNYSVRMWAPENKSQVELGGHCMSVVGYNKTGFIIRNSWGELWGDNGYCIFPYSDFGMQWEIWTCVDDNSYKPIEDITNNNDNTTLCDRCIIN